MSSYIIYRIEDEDYTMWTYNNSKHNYNVSSDKVTTSKLQIKLGWQVIYTWIDNFKMLEELCYKERLLSFPCSSKGNVAFKIIIR